MSARPVAVAISGRAYKVRNRDLSALNAYGLCESNPGVISIDDKAHESEFQKRDTLLHEVMHAVLRQQGRTYTKAEELYVTSLATGLLGTLRSNPKLAAYLLAP